MGATKLRMQQPPFCKTNKQVTEGTKNADWNSQPMTDLYPQSASGQSEKYFTIKRISYSLISGKN